MSTSKALERRTRLRAPGRLTVGLAALLLGPLGLFSGPRQAVVRAATAQAPSAVISPEELMQRIDASQRDLRTLSGEFVQHSRVKLFKQQISSMGRLQYVRGTPSKLRWEYTSPDVSTLLLIGERATLHIGNRPPQVFDTARDPLLGAIFTQLQLWLGNGSLASAQGDYVVSSGGTAGQPALVLAPRPSSPLSRAFTRIELHVDGRNLQLLRLLLVELNGDEKEVVFSHLRRNGTIPDKTFQ